MRSVSIDCPYCRARNEIVSPDPPVYEAISCSHCGKPLGRWCDHDQECCPQVDQSASPSADHFRRSPKPARGAIPRAPAVGFARRIRF
jgi:phage FluMu protein Com